MLDCMNPIYLPLPNSEIPEYVPNVAFLIIQDKYWIPKPPQVYYTERQTHQFIHIIQSKKRCSLVGHYCGERKYSISENGDR